MGALAFNHGHLNADNSPSVLCYLLEYLKHTDHVPCYILLMLDCINRLKGCLAQDVNIHPGVNLLLQLQLLPVIAFIKLWKETLNSNITMLLEPQFFDVPNFPEFLGDPKNIRVFFIKKKHSDLLAVRLEEIDV